MSHDDDGFDGPPDSPAAKLIETELTRAPFQHFLIRTIDGERLHVSSPHMVILYQDHFFCAGHASGWSQILYSAVVGTRVIDRQ
ncbi:MAG: hypothetical protein QM770_09385 [Tepidisphaeraceae bacterium]